jgi:hypothetical protein
VRAACRAHPQVDLLVATQVSRRIAEFRGVDVVVGALRRAGFDDREVARYRVSFAVLRPSGRG